MPESPFPHLQLIEVRRGPARLTGGGKADPRLQFNKDNRQQHVTNISAKLSRIGQRFQRVSEERSSGQLPPIEGGVPFMLEVAENDERLLDFLGKKLGLEVVAEYPDGFLMVSAANVEMPEFRAILQAFQQSQHGATRAAAVFEVYDEPDAEARLKRILGDELFALWPFPDDKEFVLEVSFKSATADNLKPKPNKRKNEQSVAYNQRYAAWEEERRNAMIQIDNEQIRRETLAESLTLPVCSNSCFQTKAPSCIELLSLNRLAGQHGPKTQRPTSKQAIFVCWDMVSLMLSGPLQIRNIV